MHSLMRMPVSVSAIAVTLICTLSITLMSTTPVWSQQIEQETVNVLTLGDCISIAQQIQPSIQAQRSGVLAAVEQRNIAKSAYLPQIGFQAQYTNLNESRTVDIDNVYTDEIVDVFSDAAAFFGIARQAGAATANYALDNPSTPLFPGGPSFDSAKQAAIGGISQDIQVGLLGANSLITQTQLVQPLWTGGKIDSRNVQAELGVKAAGLNVVKSRYQVAFNVTRAYLSVLLTAELEQAAKDAAGQSRAIESLVDSYVKAGDRWVTTADYHRARSIRLLFEDQQIGFQRGQARAYAALKLAMGLEQENLITVAARELPRELRHVDWGTIHELALARQPDLVRAQVGEQIACQEVRAARAEYRPDVALFGSLITVSDDENFPNPNNPQEWSVGVMAQVPIYTGGRRGAQLRRAKHLRNQVTQVREQVAQAVTQEARDAFLEYQEMGQRLAVSRQAVNSAEETSRSLDAIFQGGFLENEDYAEHFKDVLTARLLLLTSQTRYNQALFGYNVALARLKLVTVSNELPRNETSSNETSSNEPVGDESPSTIQMHFSDGDDLPSPDN